MGRETGITDGILDHGNVKELQGWRLTPSTGHDTSISSHRSSSTVDTSTSLHSDFANLRSFQNSYTPSQPSPSTSSRSRIQAHLETEPPVRYSGYIQHVDEDTEISSFELHQSRRTSSRDSASIPSSTQVPCLILQIILLRSFMFNFQWDHSSFIELFEPDPQARTLSLLQQRAFLLRELAKYHEQG